MADIDPLMMIIGAGTALAGSGIGIGGGLFSGYQSYKYASRLMSKQQRWMEKMSNSAHQREVADLRAAGLNPILSSHSAGSQVGSASSPSVAVPNLGEAALSGLKSGAEVASIGLGLANTAADTKLKDAQIETQNTAQKLNLANAAKAQADAEFTRVRTNKENASPFSTGFGRDLSTMPKFLFDSAKKYIGDPVKSYLFDRQKSSATKKNKFGRRFANPGPEYSVDGAKLKDRSPNYFDFEDKSGRSPRIMRYRIDKNGKFHYLVD